MTPDGCGKDDGSRDYVTGPGKSKAQQPMARVVAC